MNQPWMPLHVGDYLRDTRRLSTLEHGAYLLLIMDYWANESLPDDDVALARIAGLSNAQWRKVRPVLAKFFQFGWKHKRIEEELSGARKRSEVSRDAAKKRWNTMGAACDGNADAMPSEHVVGNAETMPPQPQPYREGDSERERARAADAKRAEIETDFGEFYSAYPKHENRRPAKTRYGAVRNRGVSKSTIMSGLDRWKARWSAEATEIQFIPAPDVWLNKAKYDDDLPAIRAGPSGQTTAPSSHAEGRTNGTPKTAVSFARTLAERLTNGGEEDFKLSASDGGSESGAVARMLSKG